MRASSLGEDEGALLLIGIAAVVGYVLYKGSIAKALVDAGNGAITGVVNQAGSVVGLPTTDQVTTDPHVARYIIDATNQYGGQFMASKWSSAGAYAQAQMLPAGSGYPPPANTQLAAMFPPLVGPVYDPSTDGDYSTWEDFEQSLNLGL